MRIQPLHKGHTQTINQMIESCETVILGIGSTNVNNKWNPYSFEDRKMMVQNVFGDRLKIIQLADLDTQDDNNDWIDYVLEKIYKIGLPDPTDYFTGSVADSRWYTDRFFLEGTPIQWNTFMIQEQWKNRFKIKDQKRECHIINRDHNNVPPATDLRTFLELGQPDWKEWVPRVNHQLVLDKFPEIYRIK